MRIGFFGGSFDPVHQAHLALARLALDHLKLDRLLWVPVGRPWQKQHELAADEHRVAMLKLAIAGELRYALDTMELDRAGPSYTLDSVRELRAREPRAEIFLIIGQDQYAGLPSWHGWRDLLPLVTLAVAGRNAEAPLPAAALAAVPHRVEALPLPAMAVSSTEIRERLARGEAAAALVPALVPAAVARYIDQHRLYAGA
ncbi:MAG TPA: nicotinate-nucleotide adenylyltransferase [Methylibium sp.]